VQNTFKGGVEMAPYLGHALIAKLSIASPAARLSKVIT